MTKMSIDVTQDYSDDSKNNFTNHMVVKLKSKRETITK